MNEEILNRLTSRSPRQRIGNAIGRFGALATGHAPSDNTDALDRMIKYNQLQTGSPEFKMQEAQTRADMNLQSALDVEDAKRAVALRRAEEAGYTVGSQPPTLPQQTTPIVTSSFDTMQEPKVPAVANPEFSPMGQMTSSGPRFIQVPKSPPTQKYDESIGAMVNVPAEFGYEVDPTYKQELENQGALKKEEGKLQVKRGDLANTVNAFRSISDQIPRKYGIDRFKQGAKNIYSRTMQQKGDPLASTSAAYEGARNNLVVAVARLKDVGNLSQSEQQAAAALVPKDIDSPQVYETKMAYLDALAGASTPEEIKALINGFASGQPAPKSINGGNANIPTFSSEAEALASGVKGDVIIAGKEATIS